MLRGPKGEQRPADVIGAAVRVMRIATGKEEDAPPPDSGKDAAAVSMGRKGWATRAAAMTPERWAEVARSVGLIDAQAEPAKARGPCKPRVAKVA